MLIGLASSSPRRRELLSRLGVTFDVCPAPFIERLPTAGESAADYAAELAVGKAIATQARGAHDVVLGADTVVTLDTTILGKPVDDQDAVRMLLLLSGRKHVVITAVAVACGESLHIASSQTTVTMRPFARLDAEAYVATGEPRDKAGAYGIQGHGGQLVSAVAGCYNNVVGLPLCLAARLIGFCGVATATSGEVACGHSDSVHP